MSLLPVEQPSPIKLPAELVHFFGAAPLVGDEKPKEYENFFLSIATAVKPSNPIDWLYLKDLVDLSWDIRRERIMKAYIIEQMTNEVIHSLKPAFYGIELHSGSQTWANNPKERKAIDVQLKKMGYEPSAILALAFIRGGDAIDAIDRRIAGYEHRRTAVLKEINYWSEKLAKSSAEIIDAEFTEAGQ
jgi:hypothetical protein